MTIEARSPLWKRLAWFVALWAAGVAVVGTTAYLIRWWIHP
jgi:phage shock protein PspC (stress-responsive transcriptional regulator)